MSNMKNVSTMTVAFGNVPVDVLDFAVRDFALDLELASGETSIVTMDNEREIVVYDPYDSPVPSLIQVNALACLNDHINNVPESELRASIAEDDYHCGNPEHISNPDIECYCSMDDCILVTVYQFTYYAQDCVVSAYYVTPTE